MLIAKIKQFYRHNANLENGVLVVAFVVAMGFLWNTMSTLQKNFELQQQVDTMNQQIELMQIETDLLAYEQKYYESSEYIELSAREHLNKASPGEKVLVLPEVKPQKNTGAVVADTEIPEQGSNLDQWLYFFFGSKQE